MKVIDRVKLYQLETYVNKITAMLLKKHAFCRKHLRNLSFFIKDCKQLFLFSLDFSYTCKLLEGCVWFDGVLQGSELRKAIITGKLCWASHAWKLGKQRSLVADHITRPEDIWWQQPYSMMAGTIINFSKLLLNESCHHAVLEKTYQNQATFHHHAAQSFPLWPAVQLILDSHSKH